MTAIEPRPVSLGSAGRSTLLLTGAAVIVQGVGFFRQLYLAAEVGVASGLDALLIAMATPLALAAVLTAGIRPALVPAYADARGERGLNAARRLVGSVLLWTGFAGVSISLSIWVFAEPLVSLAGPGLADAGTASAAVQYMRMLAPLAFLGTASSVFYALCQAEQLFPALALGMISEAVLTLAVMVYFWDSMALDALVLGTLAGALANLAIIVSATAARRVAPLPTIALRGTGLSRLLRHALPLSLSAVALQVNEFIRRAFASLLLEGGVSVLRFGDSLVRLPFAAIAPAFSSAVYPSLVQASRGPRGNELADVTERVLRYTVTFFVPLAGLTIAVAPVAAAVAYDRGAFSESDLELTAQVVAVSAPLIVSWPIIPTMASALNARRKSAVLLASGLLQVFVSTALMIVLGQVLGVVGVALATTVVSVILIVFLGHRLIILEPSLSASAVWRTSLKACVAAAPATIAFGIPIWMGLGSGSFGLGLATLAIVGMLGLSSYFAIARRIGLTEAGAILSFGVDTLRRVLSRVPMATRR